VAIEDRQYRNIFRMMTSDVLDEDTARNRDTSPFLEYAMDKLGI